MSEMEQQNRDWSFAVNLSGISAPTGGAVELPEGFYVAKVSDMYINTAKNAERVVIKLTVADGPFTGTVRTDGLNVPKSADDKVRYYWRGLAESAGYTSAQLDAGQINIGPGAFKDRTVHFKYTPKKGEGTYEKVLYLTPTEWNNQRQAFSAQQAARPASAPVAALGGSSTTATVSIVSGGGLTGAAPQAPANGASVTTRDDLLAKLGVPNLA
jgi:hypothetical protein